VFPIRGEYGVEDSRIASVFLLEFGEEDDRSIHMVSMWFLSSNPGFGVGVAGSTDEDHVTAFHGYRVSLSGWVLHRERMVGVADQGTDFHNSSSGITRKSWVWYPNRTNPSFPTKIPWKLMPGISPRNRTGYPTGSGSDTILCFGEKTTRNWEVIPIGKLTGLSRWASRGIHESILSCG
jgi:hypothetical protein